MSDFHGRVMNIECNMSASICRPAEDTALAYKYGHRDARHAAAEIANEADRAIRDAGAAIASKDAEIARLRDALAPFAEISKHFNDGESGLIHGWHSTKVGSSEISVEHVHAARAAMAGGGA